MKITILFVMLCIAVSGCKDDVAQPNPNPKIITTVVKFELEPAKTDGWLYYSFDREAIIPPDSANTDIWDIKFKYLDFDPAAPNWSPLIAIFVQKSALYLNSGSAHPAGKTVGVVVDSSFAELRSSPSDEAFKADDTTSQKSVLTFSNFLSYSGPPNHVMSPKANATLVLRTAKGTYVKFQLLSIYKGRPENPTKDTDVGYYSFAYAKGDGKILK